jgi:hypothetical protein
MDELFLNVIFNKGKGVLAPLIEKELLETKFLWKKRINRCRYEMCRRNDAMRYKANNQDTFDGQFKLENWKKLFTSILKMLIRKKLFVIETY